MKKILLTAVLGIALTSVSCSSVKNAKVAQTQKKEFLQLKGDWEITSIDYDKKFKIKPFDEGADAQCFVGSHWRFIPNNNTGSYSLKGGGSCPTVLRPISFDVTDGNQFSFKKLVDGNKAKTVTAGYFLNYSQQTTDQFSLTQNLANNGETIVVTYNFQRTAMTN